MERDPDVAELGELRRRAYGPGGGLDANEAHRLEQLEAAARLRAEVTGAAVAPGHPDDAEREDDPFAGMWTQANPAAVPRAPTPDGAAVVDPRGAQTARVPRPRSMLIAVGATALVCGLVIGGIVGALNGGVIRPPADTILRPLASPPADDQMLALAGRLGGEATFFEPYGGLTVVAMQAEGKHPCVMIAVKESEGFAYPIAYGCGSETWTAVAEISPLMWGGADPVLAEVADGDALRFELVGDVVEVRVGGIGTG